MQKAGCRSMDDQSEQSSHAGKPLPQAAAGAAQPPALLPDFDANAWEQILRSVPWGIGVLDAETGRTLWLNDTLLSMFEEGAVGNHLMGMLPKQYLSGLKSGEWEAAWHEISHTPQRGGASETRRLQYVRRNSREIGYWDWTLHRAADPRIFLLTLQSVSESVFNEKYLATAGRTAERGRQRAEALVRFHHRVSEALLAPDLHQIIAEEAAAYFDSESAAVLTLQNDAFHIEYSMGLAAENFNAEFLQSQHGTLAERAIAQHRALALPDTRQDGVRTPLLANGLHPEALVSSPIRVGAATYGVVEVYFRQPRIIPTEAVTLLSNFSEQIALALQNADLFKQIDDKKRQLQSIFNNVPASIVYFDTDLRIVDLNPNAARNYAPPDMEVIGLRYDEVFHDVPPDIFPNVRAGQPFHASHYTYRLANGTDSVCDVSLLPLRDEKGAVAGLVLLSFEINELVQARQEAEAARIAAENALEEVRATQTQMLQMEKMRAIGELASGVAHDLNNALMAILGYTELAEDSPDDPATVGKSLAVIRKATEDASSTVRRLQNFARQRAVSHGEPTDINQVVQDVVEMTRPRWRDEAQKQGRNYEVGVHPGAVPPILAEASGLREVLINLIHNALNAMPQGGRLTFTTRTGDEGREVEIEVADTGMGMSPEVAARAFDPFFTTRGVEGTGLGLAVSWTIIQRHGGSIQIESTPDKGTRFLIRLPVGRQTIQMASQDKLPPRPLNGGARILVVDDEAFVSSILTSILTRHGHRVTAAQSAKEALRYLREPDAEYQLVITDHGMPEMTGLELIAEIHRNGPPVPILLLTGWGSTLLQDNIPDATPEEVLGKPINQSDLLDAVQRVLHKNELHETADSPPDSV